MRNQAVPLVILVAFFAACGQLKPRDVSVPEYPDYQAIISKQAAALSGREMNKKVQLDGQFELQAFTPDSAGWAQELSFFEEINPNQAEYVGAFNKEITDQKTSLELSAGESGALKKTSYIKDGDNYSSVEATFHEDKDVYVHHREISVNFEDGIVSSFSIKGYQKMILKDTVWFSITVATMSKKNE